MTNIDPTHDPVIVAAVRTPIGKAKRGSLATTRPEDLAAAVIRELLERTKPLKPKDLDDLVIGCAFPEGEQGMNMARLIGFNAGLPYTVPAETINRFCSSGLQSIAHAAHTILAGQSEIILAPEAFTSMGLTAENVAEEFNISREDQDAFALESNKRAAAAVESGRFDPEIVPIEVEIVTPGNNGKSLTKTYTFKRDEGPRGDSTLEGLSRLRAVFKDGGTATAGNSSQMSDGAAGVIIMSQAKADELGLNPMARFISFAAGGVRPEIMGIGPVAAIPKALKLAGLTLEDIGLIELNEAFAAQSLAVIRELGLNPEITNVNGGAIALGHPLGCTGAKLTTQLLYEMARRGTKFGMVTMCIGGGMGAACIFENLQQ
jgi:acetyl-CoA acyltransferase